MNIVIVDDEFLQRELVKESIAWERLNLSLAGEAENGRNALELIREKKPEIVIMDINLPYLNGLEVSQIIKDELPETQIIILTAYDEFEYARTAIRLGAVSFILKPVDELELEHELIKASNKIQVARMERLHLEEIEEERLADKKRQFVVEAVAGFRSREEVGAKCEDYGIAGDLPFFLLLIRGKEFGEGQGECILEELQEIMKEHFLRFEMIRIEEDYIFITFAEEKGDPVHVKVKSLVSFLDEEFCNQYGVYGGISDLHKNIVDIHIAYKEAYWSANRNDGAIGYFEPENMIELKRIAKKQTESLLKGLREKDQERTNNAYDAYLEILQRKTVSNQSAIYIMMELLVEVTSCVSEYGMNIPAEYFEMQAKVIMMTTIKDREAVCEGMRAYLETALKIIEHGDIPSGARKAAEAKQFIEEFYDYEHLTLSLVAEKIGVNPSYLSSIFKKEWGETLSHYIIRIRLEKAQEILREKPWITIENVARMCGYTDVYYFSKSFKRFYGVTPAKFLMKN